MMHRLEVGMNNRKLMFSLAALVVAGVGLADSMWLAGWL